MMRFKLRRGLHSHRGHLYQVGDVFDSETDLAARFNAGGTQKFERVDDRVPTTAPPVLSLRPSPPVEPTQDEVLQSAAESGFSDTKPIETMTVKELRDLAASRGIDLGDLTKRSDILEILQESLAEA